MSHIIESPLTGGKFTHYKIKDGVRIICDGAFRGCKELIEVSIPSTINFIGDHAFSGCIKLKNIEIPESVVYIGNGAFDSSMGHVRLPAALEIIDGNPFCHECIISSNSSKFIVVDNVLFSSDMKRLISYCGTDDEYTIPRGVEIVGKQAFRSSGLKKINFSDSITTIEKHAFENNDFLHLTLPSSLMRISESAFSGCNIGCLEFLSKVKYVEDHDKYVSLEPEYNIVKVPCGLLDYYKNLLSNNEIIDIIDEDVYFENGWFLNKNRTELISSYIMGDTSEIVIPEGVLVIRDNSLYKVDSQLWEGRIHFPKSIRTINTDTLSFIKDSGSELCIPKGTREWYLSIFPDLEASIIEE